MLAYGAEDGLSHAQKAVEEAERALQRHDDMGIGQKVLSQAKETLEAVQKANSIEVAINVKNLASMLLTLSRKSVKKLTTRTRLSKAAGADEDGAQS